MPESPFANGVLLEAADNIPSSPIIAQRILTEEDFASPTATIQNSVLPLPNIRGTSLFQPDQNHFIAPPLIFDSPAQVVNLPKNISYSNNKLKAVELSPEQYPTPDASRSDIITQYLIGKGWSEAQIEILTCPITFEIFECPVMASDGNTYDNEAIYGYMQAVIKEIQAGRRDEIASPLTRENINTELRYNKNLEKLLNEIINEINLRPSARQQEKCNKNKLTPSHDRPDENMSPNKRPR